MKNFLTCKFVRFKTGCVTQTLVEHYTFGMEDFMNIFFSGVILLLAGGLLALAFADKYKTKIVTFFSAIGAILCSIPACSVLFGNESLTQTLRINDIFGEINFVIDPLCAFFILIISVMSLASVIYSNGYLKGYIDKGKSTAAHLIFLPMLIASMLLVVTCQNALMFLICWEIMSLSSFFLVIFENEKKDILKAGIKYLVFMHISVIFIILAFAFMSIEAGSFDFNSFKEFLQNNQTAANIAFLLAFVGFGTKAGFVPFHNWLPDAHPAAPSHVSAIMSGVMIKTGIYGILRMISLIDSPSLLISYTVLVISVISALYGVLYAITQHDLKRLLAYHSIENIGIIGIGIGTGMLGTAYGHPYVALLGYAGGILHILNHSIFKELLFMSAGSVYTQTHTRDIEILGGLIKSMPYSAILFLIGSVAICGLPPFNGFISEFLVYFGMLNGVSINNFFAFITFIFAIAALALVGTMAILCFTKAFSIIFLGMPRSEQAENVKHDVSKSMIIPMGFLAILTLIIGLLPQYVFKFLENPVAVVTTTPVQFSESSIALMQQISLIMAVFVLFVIALICLKFILTKGKVQMHETWGCGYDRLNNHIQYTASSYASPFLSMLKPLFKKVFDVEKPRKLFPKSAHFSLHIEDIEEEYVIHPLIKFDEWFLSKFEKMQSGNIQTYIKYGLIFLVIIIAGSLLIQ